MRSIILCSLFIFLISPIFSQESSPFQRPRLGLALSGGGAKGIAHIGVLKVLEEVGIRPDYISGTSMGSIIGGLYAIGYSADTLEQLVLEQDWDQVLSDRIPLDDVIFEEKIFFENQLLEFPFDGWKIKGPSGLIYGQQISSLLSRLTLPIFKNKEFTRFPTPFVCIAADIASGEYEVLSRGVLSDAMRISMAIPTVFTPIQKDSFLFVDGGLIHNFPVREVKDLGSDLIIGVYTGRKLANKEQLKDFSSILLQSVFLLGIQDAEEQKELCNVYLEPDLRNYTAMDFDKPDSLIAMGERAARDQYEDLQDLADFLKSNGPIPQKPNLPSLDELRIDSIEIFGNNLIPTEDIRAKFGIYPGQKIHFDQIFDGVNELYGTNFFTRVTFNIRRSKLYNILSLNCFERPPISLKLALNYDSYLKAGLLLNLTARNFITPSSRFIIGGKIAENYRFNLSYLQYLDKKQLLSLEGNLHLSREEIPIFNNGVRNEEYEVNDFLIDLRLQRRLGKNARIAFGGQREQFGFSPLTGANPIVQKLNYTALNIYGQFELNTIDRNILPTRGTVMNVQFKNLNNSNYRIEGFSPGNEINPDSVFESRPYYTISFNLKTWLRLNLKNSIRFNPFFGVIIDPSNSFGDFFLVGAPEPLTRRSIPFYGLNANELIAKFALGGTLGYQHFIQKNLMLSIDASAGYFLPPDPLESNFSSSDFFISGAGATIAYNSFIGPIKLSFMYPFVTNGVVSRKLNSFIHIGHRF